MHPLILLPLLTFVLVLGYLVWNFVSTRESQKNPNKQTGFGGDRDPMV
jgi:hypothetical protein